MHALRLLALGIVFGLLLVEIDTNQQDQDNSNNKTFRYRTALGNYMWQGNKRIVKAQWRIQRP